MRDFGRFLLLGTFVSVCGCVTQKVNPAPAAEAPSVTRIAVLPFEGSGGEFVTHEVVRNLLAAGYQVVDKAKSPQAILNGNVTEYRTSVKHMVYLGEMVMPGKGDQTVTVTNPVVTSTEVPLAAEGKGAPGAPMVLVTTAVGAAAKFTVVSSGRVIWADGFTYEATDVKSASTVVGKVLVSSLQRNALRGGKK